MRIYCIKRRDPSTYEEHRGFVVSASDEGRARQVVKDFLNQGAYRAEWHIFTDPTYSICQDVGVSIVPEGIILRDLWEA